ncbi:MAG: carboxypeptidase regulatory-like domain-containing protein [Planctomycetaceae bacterium]|nr:carboxypeptidase regulatory-like domain-containing protein [Planctomycetaceae bacterium]
MMNGRRSVRLAACVVVLAGWGCAARKGPDLGRVEGTVTLDGQPLAGATVTVIPAGGRPSRGVTDASGHYRLKYKRDAEGVVFGTHPIRVDPETREPDGAGKMTQEAYDAAMRKLADENPIPKEWRDGSTKITVDSGSQQFNIEMTSG